jgi:CHASE2 domain-containing sensor protein
MNANQLRVLGSICLIVGYFFILYVSVYWGCWIRLIGNLAMLPFAVKIKTWDIVGLEEFFSTIDASKIIQLSL